MMPQLIQVVLQGVATIQQKSGAPLSQAFQEAIDHYTPGKPNSPHLGPDAPPLQG